jgi:predicted nucleic acid-binding protein
VLNGLQVAVRRGRITAAYRDASLDDLRPLAIAVDPETNRQAWAATLSLCERFGLTAYDAAYLELAQRRRLPLATLDDELIRAAQAEKVSQVGTRNDHDEAR